jgi:hypothetical protein
MPPLRRRSSFVIILDLVGPIGDDLEPVLHEIVQHSTAREAIATGLDGAGYTDVEVESFRLDGPLFPAGHRPGRTRIPFDQADHDAREGR